jgi:cold shock CspA family protein
MNRGKIAVYNTSNGKGIILLENKEKLDFDFSQWNDKDIPQLNDEIIIDENNLIKKYC